MEKGLSVRQLEALAKRSGPSGSKRSPQEPDPYLQSLADTLKRSLGTKVDIRKRGKTGRIVVYFYSDEELDRLLERLA
jgi:ParB family chromosome partitioning protein